jgi:FAD:protein FMN transferase
MKRLLLLLLFVLPHCVKGPGAIHIERAWIVMGSPFSIATDSPQSEVHQSKAIEEAKEEVFRIDREMSLYKEESNLSKLNRSAGRGGTQVSSSMLDLLEKAARYHQETSGAFNPAIGPLVALWKMYEPWKGEDRPLPPQNSIQKAIGLTDITNVRIDRNRGQVELVHKGMKLDLNGIAKGYALDLAREKLIHGKIKAGILNLGGQLLFVGRPQKGENWAVAIRHPRHADQIVAYIRVPSGSIATSGDYERYFVHDGKSYSHIIDPRTGVPSEASMAVTVWAPTATEADAWSTALFVLGPIEGKKRLSGHPEIGAVWIEQRLIVTGALIGRVSER